jgi:peptidoglycan-N-acetylglucosamine deacetylase
MGFEVANHTQSHPSMDKLNAGEMKYQIEYIEKKCDSMKIPIPQSFAYPGYKLNNSLLAILEQKGYLFGRGGGDRAYDPLNDHPLLIPSWGMGASNKEEIYNAFKEAKNGKIVVITMHGIPDIEHSWVTIPPGLFNEYLKYLSDNHFKVLAMRDLNKYIDARQAMKKIDFNLIIK